MNYDLRLHGRKVLFAEFLIAAGIGATLTCTYIFYPGIAATYRFLSIFWLGFTLNCMTLFLITLDLARWGETKEPGMMLSESETRNLRRASLLIFVLILVPFATALLQLYQKGGQGYEKSKTNPRQPEIVTYAP